MAPLNMLQENYTQNDIARNVPIINATLEYRQVDHQSIMFEVEAKNMNTPVSILIDS